MAKTKKVVSDNEKYKKKINKTYLTLKKNKLGESFFINLKPFLKNKKTNYKLLNKLLKNYNSKKQYKEIQEHSYIFLQKRKLFFDFNRILNMSNDKYDKLKDSVKQNDKIKNYIFTGGLAGRVIITKNMALKFYKPKAFTTEIKEEVYKKFRKRKTTHLSYKKLIKKVLEIKTRKKERNEKEILVKIFPSGGVVRRNSDTGFRHNKKVNTQEEKYKNIDKNTLLMNIVYLFDKKQKGGKIQNKLLNNECGFNEIIVQYFLNKIALKKGFPSKYFIKYHDFYLLENNSIIIKMEKCGFELKIKDDNSSKMVTNVHELVEEIFSYLDPKTQKKFIKYVVLTLFLGYNSNFVGKKELNEVDNLLFLLENKTNIFYEDNKFIDKIKLKINKNSFFYILTKLNQKVGFIHGDLKLPNVFLRKNEKINTSDKKVVRVNIKKMKENDDFSFLEEMSCVIADLDKSRLQIPKDEYKKLIKY
jgi:hypothetical protein